jgi:hypothetical protein
MLFDIPSSFQINSPLLLCLATISIQTYPDFSCSPLMDLGPLILRAPNLAAFELWDKDEMDAIGSRTVIESDERLVPNHSLLVRLFWNEDLICEWNGTLFMREWNTQTVKRKELGG